MNVNTFGKWLFGLSMLFYLLVHLWGVNPWWTLVPSFAAGIAMTILVEKFGGKTTFVLGIFWITFTISVSLFFH